MDPDACDDEDDHLERIFLARSLREAQAVEAVLADGGVDYDVKVEAYTRSFLFGTLRQGAAFYVPRGEAEAWRTRLRDQGFAKGVVFDDPA